MNLKSPIPSAIRAVLTFSAGVLFLIGCSAKPIQSTLRGYCYELVVPQLVWKGRAGAYVGEYLLTLTGRESVFWDKDVVGQLDIGDRVRVDQVLKDWNGTYGNFFRVQVEILDGPFKGVKTDVPSHAPYHPLQSWIAEWTSDPNELRFKPEIARPCNT